MLITQNDIDRLLSHIIDYSDPNKCWETDLLHEKGYPYFQLQGKKCRASRVAYTSAFGQIPEGMFVLHKCNNSKCINPYHLKLGTHKENMLDRKLANRIAKGEKNGAAKLNDTDILNILQGIENEKFSSILQIADYYEITRAEIEQILKGKLWTHITSTYHIPIKELKNKISNKDVQKKLRAAQIGENSPCHKLTKEDVIQIKILLKQNYKLCYIAKQFNVSRVNIAHIRDGKIWQHVK